MPIHPDFKFIFNNLMVFLSLLPVVFFQVDKKFCFFNKIDARKGLVGSDESMFL